VVIYTGNVNLGPQAYFGKDGGVWLRRVSL